MAEYCYDLFLQSDSLRAQLLPAMQWSNRLDVTDSWSSNNTST